MSGAGARAAAEAAAQTLGKATVRIRLPLPPAASADGEELGLPSAEFRDIAITPSVVRTRRDGSREVLIGASTMEDALLAENATAVQATLQSAAFVQVEEDMLLLRSVEVCSMAGRAYLYRLLLRDASSEVRA